MGRIVPLSLLVSALIIESLAAAEPWDPKIHVRPRTYVAPRIAERIPRPLSKRQTAQKPGQPLRAAPEDKILGYEVVGQSGVSAQQLFLGDKNKVCTPPVGRLPELRLSALKNIGLYNRQSRRKCCSSQRSFRLGCRVQH